MAKATTRTRQGDLVRIDHVRARRVRVSATKGLTGKSSRQATVDLYVDEPKSELSAKEAAELLGVTAWSIYEGVQRREIPSLVRIPTWWVHEQSRRGEVA
jgi:hypothetical protein